MEGRFLRGMLLGLAAGAVLSTKMETVMENCPFLQELKDKLSCAANGQDSAHKHTCPASPTGVPRARLMARKGRHATARSY